MSKSNYKSFAFNKSDREMLAYLSKLYGSNESATIRRLIIETYTRERIIEEKMLHENGC